MPSSASSSQISTNRLTRGQMRALLQQHIEAGCTDILAAEPVNHFEAPPPEAPVAPIVAAPAADYMEEAPTPEIHHAAPAVVRKAVVAPKPVVGGQAQAPQEHQSAVLQARQMAAEAQDLPALQQVLENFTGCALKRTAKNTVFCDGIAGASVMLVGEAPGQDEDRHGKPFVGASGQLLDTMLSHIGLSRESNIYISNIIAWRPPGNRNPSAEEIEICLPFIQRHIVLARPDYLLFIGGTSTKALLGVETGITRLRGQWQSYLADGREIPALPLLHPAYLLRRPETKADMWADLCAFKARLAEASS